MTASRHIVCRARDADFAGPPEWAAKAEGLRRWAAISEDTGAAHTGFGVCELGPGGEMPGHVHSFEQSFYLLAGEAVLRTPEGAFRLGEGDYGLVPVGVPHAWRNEGAVATRWADMQAPQPRGRYHGDTLQVDVAGHPSAVLLDLKDPRTRSFGHITAASMSGPSPDEVSMRTARLVYSGIAVKMMVDTDLGAQLQTMFMVAYAADGVAGAHDHPFEETYLILEGATDATFDGQAYRLEPGDIAWAGAGCVHSFRNAGSEPVRWLETQAPQPPARHSYRFANDWDYLQGIVGS
ncbi:MAG: cupin domain-containing protein [Streptosporangiaceae bacterium]|nr:cupin domain-containing protein [Streptosporangiaceae bacterium]